MVAAALPVAVLGAAEAQAADRYESNKAGKSAKQVKRAVKKVGFSRPQVERELGR